MDKINFLRLSSWAWLILLSYWIYSGMKTKMTIRKQNTVSRISHLILVISAFALIYEDRMGIGILGYRFYPHKTMMELAGLLINLAGIGFSVVARIWLGSNWSAMVTVKQDHALISSGPYTITRHPIYSGMLLAISGAAIILGEIRGLVAVGLFLIAIEIKMAMEEKFMKSTFSTYEGYIRKTKKLIPLIY